MQENRLLPKIYTILRNEKYSFECFRKDLLSGLIIAILTIPLCISFGISSGVRPEQGLITAIIGGLLVSLLGGSRYQISGPTGAFIILIYSIIQKYGYQGLACATLLAGIIMILFGVFKIGKLVKLIPYPVVVGLTSGLALVIFMNQVGDFLGIQFTKGSFSYLNFIYYIKTINLYSTFIGGLSLFIVIFWRKVSSKIPGSLIAVIVCSLLILIFDFPVETIGKRFGEIKCSFPSLTFPKLDIKNILGITSAGISIAFLAGIESLLSCVVADGMTGKSHKPDAELVAQGVGNIISVLFLGIPITAGFARTATNIKNGGKTPFASFFSGIILLIFIIFLGNLLVYIPIATLAAIIFVVAFNMSEFSVLRKLFLSPKTDIIVLVITFLATIFLGLILAVQIGIILSILLFAYQVTSSTYGKLLREKTEEELAEDPWRLELREIPKEIEVFEIQGPFSFAAVEKFKTSIYRINYNPKFLILRFRYVPFMDASALRAIEDVIIYTGKQKITLLFSGIQKDLKKIIKKSQLINEIGEENIFSTIDQALLFAKNSLAKDKILSEIPSPLHS